MIPLKFQSQALLPVEVLGPHGTTDSRQFNLPDASEAGILYLQVNNFTFDGKVEVRLNAETNWTPLSNSNIYSDAQGNAFGKIGGGYSTLKVFANFIIPTNRRIRDALVDGVNTIYFRFNGINDAKTIGFRILEFNFLKSDGTPLLSSSQFIHQDPSTWGPVYSDQASIDAGEDLWFNKVNIDNPLNPVPIKAKCASCHSERGEDLKYYNYSNLSIIERSKFHGLTQLEGEQIASYIRSLNTPSPFEARPWNPPYQPGPGLDSKPVTDWSAGAGLEAVLDSDSEMLPYMFPDGTSDAALEGIFDLKGTMNIREMPVAIQFPDWNDWLPEIHPLDMMSASAYQDLITGIGGVRFQRPSGTYGYQKVKENLENNGVAAYNDGVGKNLQTILLELGAGAQDFLFKDYIDASGGLFWWTIKDSPGIRERPSGMLVETFKKNIAKWNSVKHWEIMQRFQIEDVKPVNVPYAEERQWPTTNWSVFAIAPHIVADKRGDSRFEGQSANMGYYESTVWYQLQMTLNSGMREPVDVAPVDWSYNFDHVYKASTLASNNKEPLRYIQNFIKGYQQRDNNVFNNGNSLVNNSAWNMREVSPWRLYSVASGDTSLHDELDVYEVGLRAKLTSKLLKMFNDKAASLDESDWPRGNDGAWWKLETMAYIPSNYSTGTCLFPNADGFCSDIQNANEADAIFTLIPLLQSINVDCVEVERLRVWAKGMWPLGDWDQFIDSSCTLGVNDVTSNNVFRAYPNPTKGIIRLSNLVEWSIFDIMGKSLKSGYSQEINLDFLPDAMYFLKTPNGTIKIIKNNKKHIENFYC
ncbi:cellulase [Jejuia pallidilutea]|nr:cellulase [Jejuia pallidilutea]